jgi:mannose-6-phosphate isomerase-like protein (cupin superfamily)
MSDRQDPREEIFVVERPWGQFQQFVSNEQVTVKIITVEPGHRLSLQTHDHRGEMWQVLDVPIEVTVGERTWSAEPGETVWVPTRTVHRMANKGDRAGRLLEVAFGDFDEADIVRLEDDYAR